MKYFKTKPEQLSDQKLLEHYQKSGDMEYLGVLYARYMEMVYGTSLKYFKEEGRASDAVMGVFETLAKKAKTHEVGQFRGWLYVMTKNYCLMELRKDKKNLTVSYDPQFMQSDEDKHPVFEIEIEEDGQLEALKTCMEGLATQQKQCIELFYYKEKSYKEIAALLDKKVGTIRSFIQNGRRNLKICMEKKDEKIIRK